MTQPRQNVVILGASDNPERYSYKAFQLLRQMGHHALPVSPRIQELAGERVYHDLSSIDLKVDTLTMYVSSEISRGLLDAILNLKPRRVIFNPGTESPDLAASLVAEGVEVLEACTLVLLKTGQF